MRRKSIYCGALAALLTLAIPFQLQAQRIDKDDPRMAEVDSLFKMNSPSGFSNGPVQVKSAELRGRTLRLILNDNATNFPFRKENIQRLRDEIRKLFDGAETPVDAVLLYANGRAVEDLVPQAFGGSVRRPAWGKIYPKGTAPLVRKLNPVISPTKGLEGMHIAMWQSHGLYFANKPQKWLWQRSKLNLTVEDLFTQSYVLPYIVPMLENSGAVVILPKERDVSEKEYIVDNDASDFTKGTFTLSGKDKRRWKKNKSAGFGYKKATLKDHDNPFRWGTTLSVPVQEGQSTTTAVWTPKIDTSGEYAVYVSYATLPGSVNDARYTVKHAGGSETILVNQQMGGGTWVYIGTFPFTKGAKEQGISLSNHSSHDRGVVTADAVKIGGGMGNVARASATTRRRGKRRVRVAPKEYTISGYPRYCEGARYWLQWAGIPDSVYAPSRGVDDYKDDYRCRGLWVNHLSGGTATNPDVKGLNIPINLSFAMHSDAGIKPGNGIVGTLAIYDTTYEGTHYDANDMPKYASRELADIVQSYIVRDVKTLSPEWMRRGMWDKPYSEATSPNLPSMLLEFLSHQNVSDMRYGLDPTFRFVVSRAIYKGILRFLANEFDRPYVVQPLPVQGMRLEMDRDGKRVRLSWDHPTDPSEPTANPQGYILYTAVGDVDAPFDRGVAVFDNSAVVSLKPGEVYRFKVAAFNEGGLGFPSEVLAAGIAPQEKGRVMVVNGFDMVSTPECHTLPDGTLWGFRADRDGGVPYIRDIANCRSNHSMSVPEPDDDHEPLGFHQKETQVIAGNTFDFAARHGASFLRQGYSFVSGSRMAVERDPDLLKPYTLVDLILGKQKTYTPGPDDGRPALFTTMNPDLQFAIESYLMNGGSLLASGAYIASDLYKDTKTPRGRLDSDFAREVLKISLHSQAASRAGSLRLVPLTDDQESSLLTYNPTANSEKYALESPDALAPAGEEGILVPLKFADNGLSAGVLFRGDYNSCILSVPLEVLSTDDMLDRVTGSILRYFSAGAPRSYPK